jgi:DNA-binding transcriptional MerR regulator
MELGPDKTFQIGEIAACLGISPKTIRYYEEIGLPGLSLAEVHELNGLYRIYKKNSKLLPRLIELLDTHLKEIDKRIEGMILLKKEIQQYRERTMEKLAGGENRFMEIKGEEKRKWRR